jgi:hypothetical protein
MFIGASPSFEFTMQQQATIGTFGITLLVDLLL